MREIHRRPGVKMEVICDMARLRKVTIGDKNIFPTRLRITFEDVSSNKEDWWEGDPGRRSINRGGRCSCQVFSAPRNCVTVRNLSMSINDMII